MLAWILAHQGVVLSSLLSISELMAFVFPNSGGIMKGFISALKSIGAKEINNS